MHSPLFSEAQNSLAVDCEVMSVLSLFLIEKIKEIKDLKFIPSADLACGGFPVDHCI